MKTKTFVISVLLCMFSYCKPGLADSQMPITKEDNSMDVTDFSVYYDLNTNATVKTMMPRPWYQPGWRLRLPFKGGKCECDTLKCNCCSGIRVPQIGFDRQSFHGRRCMYNIRLPGRGPNSPWTLADAAETRSTYSSPGTCATEDVDRSDRRNVWNASFIWTTAKQPGNTCVVLNFNQSDGLLELEVRMRNETIIDKTFSAANPPPFCIPIPIAGVPIPLFDFCIRLFDVTLNWNKLHVCMDWDTRIDKAPIVILHFDCMDMGTGGISISKPGSSNESPSASESAQLNADVYDPVTELANTSTISPNINNGSKYT